MLILEGNLKWNLDAFASELFMYTYIYIHTYIYVYIYIYIYIYGTTYRFHNFSAGLYVYRVCIYYLSRMRCI